MPLKNIHCDVESGTRHANFSGSIKTLETINGKPVAEFWKEVEASAATQFDSPVFQAWMKDVTALPAERQIEAVTKKLGDLNPEFLVYDYEKVEHKIEEGVVTFLAFPGDYVSNLAPVRALAGLKQLYVLNHTGHTAISDLSPLKGLALTHLCVSGSRQLSDLSPLKGMPLTFLQCSACGISDLTPLKRLPLETLDFDFKPSRDLEILRSMTTLQIINLRSADDFWADLPAERLVEAVRKELKERNPFFDEKVSSYRVEKNVVTSFGLSRFRELVRSSIIRHCRACRSHRFP